jgi:hypothetical protein
LIVRLGSCEQLAPEGMAFVRGEVNFRPVKAVARGQMSVFLVKTFGLP